MFLPAHTRMLLTGLLFVTAGLAGCVVDETDEDLPRIQIEPEKEAWPAGTDNTFEVSFTNTAERTYRFTSGDTCAFAVRVLDAPSEPPNIGLSQVCGDAITDFSVAPGETLRDTFTWDGTAPDTDQAVEPGTYTLEARFAGTGHSWDATNTTTVTLEPADDGKEGDKEDRTEDETQEDTEDPDDPRPRTRVLPGNDTWPQGTDTSIRVVFENTADVTYRFTSSDGCKDFIVHARDTGGPQGGDTRLWPPEGPYACTQALTDYEVAPGERMEMLFSWDGAQDWGSDESYVVPGTYRIEADVEHTGETTWEARGSTEVTLESA